MTGLLFAGVTAAPLCTPSGSRAGRRRPSSTAFSRPALTRPTASSASNPAACATRRRPRFSPRPRNRCGGFARASGTEVRRPATLGGTRRVRTRTASKPPLCRFDCLVGRPPRHAASSACAWPPPTPRPHSWHRHGQAGESGRRGQQRPPGRSTIPIACWRVQCLRRPGSETNPDGAALLRRRLPMKRHHTTAAGTATATSVRPRGDAENRGGGSRQFDAVAVHLLHNADDETTTSSVRPSGAARAGAGHGRAASTRRGSAGRRGAVPTGAADRVGGEPHVRGCAPAEAGWAQRRATKGGTWRCKTLLPAQR